MKNIKTILCSTLAGAMMLCCNLSYCQPVPANHEMDSDIEQTLWIFEDMMLTHINLQKDSAFFLLKGEVKSIEQEVNQEKDLPFSRNFNENENECSVTFDKGGNVTNYNDWNYVYEGGKILYRVCNRQKRKHVYEYDKSGNISVIKYFCPADDKACMYKIYHTYDDRGNMTERRTVASNRKGKETMVSDVLFKYYENGMPAEKKILIHAELYWVHGAGGIDADVSFIYDEKGRLTEETSIYPTRKGGIYLSYMHKFTYNDKGDLATMEDKEHIPLQDNCINRFHTYNYEYDKNGDKITLIKNIDIEPTVNVWHLEIIDVLSNKYND